MCPCMQKPLPSQPQDTASQTASLTDPRTKPAGALQPFTMPASLCTNACPPAAIQGKRTCAQLSCLPPARCNTARTRCASCPLGPSARGVQQTQQRQLPGRFTALHACSLQQQGSGTAACVGSECCRRVGVGSWQASSAHSTAISTQVPKISFYCFATPCCVAMGFGAVELWR